MRRNWCLEVGYFVCVYIKDLPFTFLIDTGSNVSILSTAMVDKLSTAFHQSIQPTNTKLLTVTGEMTPFLGKSNIHMKIGSQNINHQFF